MTIKIDDKRKAIRHQIEFILDNTSGGLQEVIIKTGQSTPEDEQFTKTVAEALRKRAMAASPRDVLPAQNKLLSAGRWTDGTRNAASKRLRNVDMSLSAQIAWAPVTSSKMQSLRQANLESMRPILQSDVVRKNLHTDRPKGRGRRADPDFQPRKFWTSSSFLMRFREEDLMKLYQDDLIENLEGVFPNRRILVPPAITPKQVPRPVEDNKVSGWGVRSIGALGVWGAFGARGKGVTIGLLDTGVDANHPDLAGKISAWAEFDAQGNEVVGAKPRDSDKHGTHCAGIIVGGNASGRWIGVAPEAKIAAALVLDGAKGGTDAQVLAGIDWAIEQEVDVINMSLGGLIWGPDVPTTYTSAILNALRVGIPVVTAIGNEGSQTSGSPGNDFLAFAVGATDHLNRAAGFSGGRTQVIRQSPFFPQDMLPLVYSKPDLSAPGVAVCSSVPNGDWEYFNGTSMAAPHVAGAIALLLSSTNIRDGVEIGERAFVIQDLLTGSADELGEAGQDHRFGFGKIDILRAIGFAKDLGY
ncbi:MAG: S8 family serine peptidase [Beijerinckiaceae bacterium]|nr:S8 family serine peptidase [Beijerinckiaceae bacterium]